jgi:hypothetical protein
MYLYYASDEAVTTHKQRNNYTHKCGKYSNYAVCYETLRNANPRTMPLNFVTNNKHGITTWNAKHVISACYSELLAKLWGHDVIQHSVSALVHTPNK